MQAQSDYTSEADMLLDRMIKRIAVNKTTSQSCIMAGQTYIYQFSERWIHDELIQSSDVIVLRNMLDLMKFTQDHTQYYAVVGEKTSITLQALKEVCERCSTEKTIFFMV